MECLSFPSLGIKGTFKLITHFLKFETEKGQDNVPVRRSRAPSLAETEEALAQAVWSWAGLAK